MVAAHDEPAGPQAFAAEARQYLGSLAAAKSHVFYTDDAGCVDGEGSDSRQLDREALAALELPTDATAYVCGPAGFMDAMTICSADLGLAPSRIRTEIFTTLSAINPGVVSSDGPAPHLPPRVGTGPKVTFARAGLPRRLTTSWRVCLSSPRPAMSPPDGPAERASAIRARRRCCRGRSLTRRAHSPTPNPVTSCCAAAAPVRSWCSIFSQLAAFPYRRIPWSSSVAA